MKQIAQAAFFALVLASNLVFGHGGEDSHDGKSEHGATIGKPGEPAKE